MAQSHNFTKGPIAGPLFLFALPVMGALLLQSLYGAVDLFIVGHFASSADVSAVSTGSQILQTFTMLTASFSMGITILLGQYIGAGRGKEGGTIAGSGICLCLLLGLFFTFCLTVFAPTFAGWMNAPAEAFEKTVSYIRICGGGMVVIICYNLIGSLFRGIGDSKTPLMTVAIASVFNTFGDLLLVAFFHQGAAGAALATVAAQTLSVVISYVIIKKRGLPFPFSLSMVRLHGATALRIVKLGLLIALQDLLVGLSFLLIMSIVNRIGLTASASIGVSEKICGFIILIPGSFMQSMSAFVAQNVGAQRFDRAEKALFSGIAMGLAAGVCMFTLSFFYGTHLTALFTSDEAVVLGAADYLKAYAIDCLLTSVLFSSIGFFNGLGMTRFVMVQGIVGAFGVRVPVSYLMSLEVPPRLFHIGLATPASSAVQILLCVIAFLYVKEKNKN